jgi:hypothetical protein
MVVVVNKHFKERMYVKWQETDHGFIVMVLVVLLIGLGLSSLRWRSGMRISL